MPRLRSSARICGTAAAASSRSTVIRTSSEPARARAAIWATVPATSAVSVLVIDCTTIGAPPPTATLPTMTCVVLCRALGPATSSWGGFMGLFMRSRISGFGDIQQWINGNRNHRAWPIDEVKPGNHQERRGAERQGQGVMQDEIASHDAKQRGDEGKSRQFAGGIALDQRKPQQKRQSDHPNRLIARGPGTRVRVSPESHAVSPRIGIDSATWYPSVFSGGAWRSAVAFAISVVAAHSAPPPTINRSPSSTLASTSVWGTPIASATPAKLKASPPHCEARSRSPRNW